MGNNIQKEKWIEAVMNSTVDINRADPPADLFEKITKRLSNEGKNRIISMPMKQWAAAAILLLALNVGSVVYFTTQTKKMSTLNSAGRFAAELQSESTYNY